MGTVAPFVTVTVSEGSAALRVLREDKERASISPRGGGRETARTHHSGKGRAGRSPGPPATAVKLNYNFCEEEEEWWRGAPPGGAYGEVTVRAFFTVGRL